MKFRCIPIHEWVIDWIWIHGRFLLVFVLISIIVYIIVKGKQYYRQDQQDLEKIIIPAIEEEIEQQNATEYLDNQLQLDEPENSEIQLHTVPLAIKKYQ